MSGWRLSWGWLCGWLGLVHCGVGCLGQQLLVGCVFLCGVIVVVIVCALGLCGVWVVVIVVVVLFENCIVDASIFFLMQFLCVVVF